MFFDLGIIPIWNVRSVSFGTHSEMKGRGLHLERVASWPKSTAFRVRFLTVPRDAGRVGRCASAPQGQAQDRGANRDVQSSHGSRHEWFASAISQERAEQSNGESTPIYLLRCILIRRVCMYDPFARSIEWLAENGNWPSLGAGHTAFGRAGREGVNSTCLYFKS
jgi:hypothetical protein